MIQDLDVQQLKEKMGLINANDVKALNDLLSQLAANPTNGMGQLKKLISSINMDEANEQRRLKELAETVKTLEEEAFGGGIPGRVDAGGGSGEVGDGAKRQVNTGS